MVGLGDGSDEVVLAGVGEEREIIALLEVDVALRALAVFRNVKVLTLRRLSHKLIDLRLNVGKVPVQSDQVCPEVLDEEIKEYELLHQKDVLE